MIITRVAATNWKCFRERTEWIFSESSNIITRRNGTGKTSMFQAILFGLYGKMPAGWNFQSLKNIPDQQTVVEVEFQLDDGQEYVAMKQFSQPALAEIRDLNGTLVAHGSKEVRAWMDQIIPYEVLSSMWTDSLVSSDVLKPAYFQEQVLGEVLKDPIRISKWCKQEAWNHQQVAKKLHNSISDIPEGCTAGQIAAEIAEVESAIRSAGEGAESEQIEAAKAAEKAAAWLEEHPCPDVSLRDAEEAAGKDPSAIAAALEAELLKIPSVPGEAGISISTLRKIIVWSEAHEESCPVCGGDAAEALHSLKELVQKGPRDENLIQQLRFDLELLNRCSPEDAQLLKQWNQQSLVVKRCPNWQEVLQQQKSELDQLWNRLHQLQELQVQMQKNQELQDQLKKEQEQLDLRKNQQKFCEKYVQQSSAYYSDQILELAGKMLSDANDRYQDVFLYDNQFSVSQLQNGELNLLTVQQLSNGEKTLVAVALVLAVQQVLFPEIPLLFDETFAALDHENLEQVRSLLSQHDGQLFVITHNKDWVQEL